jgi:hypothetical protein
MSTGAISLAPNVRIQRTTDRYRLVHSSGVQHDPLPLILETLDGVPPLLP